MKVCLPVSRIGKEVLKVVGCAAIFAVISNAFAEPPGKEIPFTQSKFPNVKVRHAPLPANDNARHVPLRGTPRTQLPVLDASGPKGGKIIQPDNTYLIQCPAPAQKIDASNSASVARKTIIH